MHAGKASLMTGWVEPPSCVQVGTGDRSEKIKTYNYKDSRCSDHRLKQNYDLNKQLDGELEDNIQVLHSMHTAQYCFSLACHPSYISRG